MSGIFCSVVKNSLSRASLQTRFITTSPHRFSKKVIVKTEDNLTTVEAEEDNTKPSSLVLCRHSELTETYCPLCPKRVPYIRYTDILILSQFVDKKGRILPRHVTGLCSNAQGFLKMHVCKAQTAGLLPRPVDHPDNFYKWNKNNIYFE